jgi:L-iditol 2-dehydrogenase
MSSLAETMKVAVYYNNKTVRVEERSVPEIGPGDLLVKTEACGLCGGETMEWYLAPRAPKVLGHEPTGVVVKAGSKNTRFKEGDRVFVHHHVGCMSCHHCNRGNFTLCEQYQKTNIHPGGFAEYFQVPEENVAFDTYILPDNVSFEEGSIIEPMACCLKGFKNAQIHSGDTFAVVGAGFMGMCFVQLARLYPFSKIVVLDFSDWRLEKALSLGATHAINPLKQNAVDVLKELNNGYLADMVVLTVPSTKAWDSAFDLCEKGAFFHCNAPAEPGQMVPFNANRMYFREITVNSSYSASHIETQAVLDLLVDKRVNARSMITHRFGLDGVADAIQLLLKSGESLKSLIIPSL